MASASRSTISAADTRRCGRWLWLPLDRIRIDHGFVVEALINPRCAAVIRAAAQFAKEFGLALTGKGVETREQFELLRSAGCDETQGYFHCRPLTEVELAAALARSLNGGNAIRAATAGLCRRRGRDRCNRA